MPIHLKIQRRTAKIVDGYKTLNYTETLKREDLSPLAQSGTAGDIIEIHKHFNSYDTITQSQTRLPIGNKFSKKQCASCSNEFFLYRRAKGWNDLRKVVTHAKNINMFKTKLD